jgi:hypothetical protein
LHYSDSTLQHQVQALVDEFGPTVEIRVLDAPYVVHVPRHYIALHGVKAAELLATAQQYGWIVTTAGRPSFTCPVCGAVSYNPNDIREQYCGRCHKFVNDPEV